MNYKNLFKTVALLLAATVLTFTACTKKNTVSNTTTNPTLSNADDNGGYASDAAKMETTSNDVISVTDAAQSSGGANLRTSSFYPTVTFSVSGSDTTMTIDFGPYATPHDCLDGKYRSGKILVTYNGPYKSAGTVRTITYNSYFVDSNQVSGSKTVTNMGTNDSGQVYYKVTVNDSLTLKGTDSIVTWTGSRVRTWLHGYTTAERIDDVYSIADGTGPAMVLTRANGHLFTFTITSPLIVAMDCWWIEGGTVDISSASFTSGDRTLNYGSSTSPVCDDLATLTIGSTTYDIYLRR